MNHNEVLVTFDGTKIKTSFKDCWYLRGQSMSKLVEEAFKLIEPEEFISMKPFAQIFSVGDHGSGEYTMCSNKYTEEIIPCYIFDHWQEARINDYSEMCEILKRRGQEPWKIDKLFWAGQLSNPSRKKFVDIFSKHPKMDIALFRDHWGHGKNILPEKYLSLPDHCNYKYMIDLQGNGYSGRTKLLFHMNRVLFYQERELNEYWFWQTKPYVHYIPIKKDLSDLNEKIEWAENHPEECREIAKNAYQFAIDNLKREDALKRMKKIIVNLGKKEKEYDMTLCVLACAKNEKYEKRLKEYIDGYGYKNINAKIKLKIVFLVNDEPRPDFLDPFFVWYNCPEIPLSMRLINYLKKEKCDSKWLMQVDDDSSTDIDKTIEMLENFYDYKDCLLLMGGRNTDLEMGLQNILRTMNSRNIFFGSSDINHFNITPYFIHAWEPSIFSASAIQRIKNWYCFNEFYDLCEKYKPIFGDQVPYVAAKMAKVPIVECLFMSPFGQIEEYSAINSNGRFTHVHYITEKMPKYFDFIEKMKQAKKNIEISNLDIKNENNLWEFWAIEKNKEKYVGLIDLKQDGTIGNYSHVNETFWEMINDNIILYNKDKIKSCIFEKISENEYAGKFLFADDVTHKLIKSFNN